MKTWSRKLGKTCLISGLIVTATAAMSSAEPTQYPLTIENCAREITFQSAPDRVVSIGQNGTETLFWLGLADVLQGTALWRSHGLPEFAAVNAKIERLDYNEPT